MTTLELCPLKTRSPQVYTYSLNNTSSVKFQGLETYKEGLALYIEYTNGKKNTN